MKIGAVRSKKIWKKQAGVPLIRNEIRLKEQRNTRETEVYNQPDVPLSF